MTRSASGTSRHVFDISAGRRRACQRRTDQADQRSGVADVQTSWSVVKRFSVSHSCPPPPTCSCFYPLSFYHPPFASSSLCAPATLYYHPPPSPPPPPSSCPPPAHNNVRNTTPRVPRVKSACGYAASIFFPLAVGAAGTRGNRPHGSVSSLSSARTTVEDKSGREGLPPRRPPVGFSPRRRRGTTSTTSRVEPTRTLQRTASGLTSLRNRDKGLI